MLNLNLIVASSDSISDKLLHLSNSQMESSESFNSSNVTADDDSYSKAACDAAFAYSFDILKPNDIVGEGTVGAKVRQVGEDEDDEGEDDSCKQKTIQLFLVMGTVRSSAPGGGGGGGVFVERAVVGLVARLGSQLRWFGGPEDCAPSAANGEDVSARTQNDNGNISEGYLSTELEDALLKQRPNCMCGFELTKSRTIVIISTFSIVK